MTRMVALAMACGLAACAGADDPVLIGVAGPFSQSRGVAMERAARLAADEINARGGVGGRPLELVFSDDSASDSVAVQVADRFAADPAVVAVVGHLNSGTSLAAARRYGAGRHPLVMITPSASSPALSGLSPYVFRACPSDVAHGAELARLAREQLGARRAAVIFDNDDYGRGLRRSFVAEFTRLGGTVIEEDPVLPPDVRLEPFLSRIGAVGGVDVLVLATHRETAELALRERAARGLRWPIIGGDALSGIEALGSLAEGVRVSLAYLTDQPGERNAAFVAAYARAYGAGAVPDHRGAAAYDVVHLIAEAVEDVGPDRRAVRDYLAGLGTRHPSFEGVTGTLAFDDRGDMPDRAVAIGVVRGGRLVTERRP
ncbi:MAG: ABC transporter substrate-binding protein [Acidimicrobiales bacterium]